MDERFWSKVDKSGDCWIWLGNKIKGYGRFYKDKKIIKAHRYSWILANGQIPEGQIVRHICRGKCVNPAHLELGTLKDNAQDRFRDNTTNRKLTDAQVLEIRRRKDESQDKLAKEFGISHQSISSLILRKTYRHI